MRFSTNNKQYGATLYTVWDISRLRARSVCAIAVRLLLFFAVLNITIATTGPAYAAKKTKGSAVPKKVEKCIKGIEKEARKNRKLPGVIVETARRHCWLTHNDKQSLPLLRSLNTKGLNFKKPDSLLVLQGFDGKTQIEEPGLMGLDGAEEVLRERLAIEVISIWSNAAAAGGPALPGATASTAKRQSRQGVTEIHVVTDQETTDGKDNDSIQLQVTNQQITGTAKPGEKTFVQDYVDQHITALKNDPDSAILLKTRMYLALKDIVLMPAAQRKAHEKRYMKAVEEYVSRQYLVMAKAAIKKYEEFDAKSSKTTTSLGALLETGDVPPNYVSEMMGAIALANSGKAAMAAINAARSGKTLFHVVGKEILKEAAEEAVKIPVTKLNTAMLSSYSSGPAAIIVTAIMTGVLQAEKVGRKAKAEKDLARLHSWAKTAKVHLHQMVNSREGLIQLEYFYAKATSQNSPGGFKDPAGSCQVCAFADKNFEGAMTCTNATIRDMRNHLVDGNKAKLNNAVSSVAIVQDSCPASFAVLYDNKGLSGDRLIVRSSIADLTVAHRSGKNSWDNAASSLAFSNKNAPKCEICTYSKANFGGRKFCTSGGISHLTSVKMADKISSVTMQTKDCPKGKAWLYKKPAFELQKNGGGVAEITKSSKDLGKGLGNSTSSIYFSAEGINPHEIKATGGCRACFYDLAGHKGKYMCANSNIPDMSKYSIGAQNFEFANKASSVQFLKDSCKPNDALELEMFTKAEFGGEVYRLFGTDLATLPKGANDNIASVKLSHLNTAKSCRVCFYKNADFQGQKQCIAADTKAFANGLNNSFSSVRFENNACKGAAIILNDAKSFGGKSIEVTRTYKNLNVLKRGNGNWNNAASSARFYKDYAAVQAEAKKLQQQLLDRNTAHAEAAAKKSCQVCVYKDRNYKGASTCYKDGSKISALSLNNSVSSIRVHRSACPQGGATIYRDKSYRGKSAFVLGDVPDTRNLPGSSVTWNNNISSLKFSRSTRTDLFNISKTTAPGLSDKQIINRINSVFGE